MAVVYLLILCSVALNAGAQILLKLGMQKIGHFEFSSANVFPIGMQVATNWHILLGLFFYVFSLVIWLLVLSRAEVSVAYPMASLGYVFVTIAAFMMFNEQVTAMRMAGIAMIIAGVFLVSKTA